MEQTKTKPDYAALLSGNARFRESNTDYRELARGQHPKHVVVACSDSRVAPEVITGSRLGELFVVMAVGQVISQSNLASLEYGVEHLGIKSIIFIAHTKCGAVTGGQEILNASVAGKLDEGIGSDLNRTLVEIYKNLVPQTQINSVDLTHAAVDNATAEAGKAIERSDILRRALSEESLSVCIALYSIEDGSLGIVKRAAYDRNTGKLGFLDER